MSCHQAVKLKVRESLGSLLDITWCSVYAGITTTLFGFSFGSAIKSSPLIFQWTFP